MADFDGVFAAICKRVQRPPRVKAMSMMKTLYVMLLIGAIFPFASLTLCQVPVPQCGPRPGFDFQIVTDRLVYAPKATMHVKFLITNASYAERQDKATGPYSFRVLYLDRTRSYCTSPTGFYWLTILDKNNKRVPIDVCSADPDMKKEDPVELFTNPKTGIALNPGDVYGSEGQFQLPAKKGKYRLKAVLFTGGFPERQLQSLAEKHIYILPSNCQVTAPVVTVTVK